MVSERRPRAALFTRPLRGGRRFGEVLPVVREGDGVHWVVLPARVEAVAVVAVVGDADEGEHEYCEGDD